MYDENDALKTFCGNRGLLKWSWGWVTSFCQATGAEAIQAFFNLLNKKNVPVILLGPSNTKSLEPIAEAAPKWKLVQVRIFNYLFEITFVAIRNLTPLRYGVISKEKLEKRFPWSIGSLSMQRFWATDGHRKCAVFLLYLSSHHHIYIFKFLCASRDDYFENLGEIFVLACKMFTSGCRPWLKNFACLSSLISAYADFEWANQIRGRCMQPHVCARKRACLTTWKFFCGCTNIKQH